MVSQADSSNAKIAEIMDIADEWADLPQTLRGMAEFRAPFEARMRAVLTSAPAADQPALPDTQPRPE